jgi:hypothetical protein
VDLYGPPILLRTRRSQRRIDTLRATFSEKLPTTLPADPLQVCKPGGEPFKLRLMVEQGRRLYWVWDDYNRHGRKVGTGTYLAVVRVSENGKRVVERRVLVGVNR